MNSGHRLREERERLGLNQKDFSEIGGVSKTTQVYYEQGKSSPNYDYWEAISTAGADVQYILTGQRSNIDPKLAAIIALFDGLTDTQRQEILFAISEKKRVFNLERELQELKKNTG